MCRLYLMFIKRLAIVSEILRRARTHDEFSRDAHTGWVLMQRRASINAAAQVNVLVHNVVGNVARHMAVRRFAWHINPKSGCWPIANNK